VLTTSATSSRSGSTSDGRKVGEGWDFTSIMIAAD
jgi:hypothetical protein